jgi:hypothetical protein
MSNSSVELYIILMNQTANFIGYYLITLVSGIGLLLNAFAFKLLLNPNLKHQFYNYLLCKTVCDFWICLIGIGYLNNACFLCVDKIYGSYSAIIYQFYIIKITIRSAIASSMLSEVYLTYERYATLTNRTKFLKNMPIKYYLILILFGPMLLITPIFFTANIQALNGTNQNIFYMATTEFGKSKFYAYYSIIILVLETVLPILLLLLFSFLNVREIKKLMKKKLEIIGKQNEIIKQSEIRFTKMIIILAFFFLITHTLDTISAISVRLVTIWAFELSPAKLSLINLLRQIANFLLFGQYLIGVFIYTSTDKNINSLAKSFFRNLV